MAVARVPCQSCSARADCGGGGRGHSPQGVRFSQTRLKTCRVGWPCLNAEQRETVDAVPGYYGDKSAQWLIDLTHSEEPWKQARVGLAPGERGNREVTLAAMADYYCGL